jgi:hypothetical protein
MANRYPRFVASLDGGSFVDERMAFEVMTGKIVSYGISYTGFGPFRKAHYEPVASLPISKGTTCNLRSCVSPGSGMCKVRTGSEEYDFHVYGQAEAFVADVEREVARCRAAS